MTSDESGLVRVISLLRLMSSFGSASTWRKENYSRIPYAVLRLATSPLVTSKSSQEVVVGTSCHTHKMAFC